MKTISDLNNLKNIYQHTKYSYAHILQQEENYIFCQIFTINKHH